jgi:hypothetical protein
MMSKMASFFTNYSRGAKLLIGEGNWNLSFPINSCTATDNILKKEKKKRKRLNVTTGIGADTEDTF